MELKEKEQKEIRDFEKNYKNPFINQAIEKIKNETSKKYTKCTNQSESAILHAIDPNTGEYIGHTTFIRQMKVDEEKFTKVYEKSFEAFWDLNKQGIRVIGYIIDLLRNLK